MAWYKVAVSQQMKQNATIIIEAPNEDDAREKAERLWCDGEITTWVDDDVDEHFGVEAQVIEEMYKEPAK
jgi:hypothetical protein